MTHHVSWGSVLQLLVGGLAARTGACIRTVRTGIELTVLGIGCALGGLVGISTVILAVTIGPLFQFFLSRFDRSTTREDARRTHRATTGAAA